MNAVPRFLVVVTTLVALTFAAPLASAAQAPPPVDVRVTVKGILCGSCLARLKAELARLPGVTLTGASLTELSLSLDEGRAPVGKVVAFVASTLARLEPGVRTSAHLVLGVDSPTCRGLASMPQSCFTDIPRALKGVTGIREVILDQSGRKVLVGFTPDAALATADISRALAGAPRSYTADFAGATTPDNL